MKVYQSEKLRNVGLVSHGGAGKTSLAEALLYNVEMTKRLGKVDEGTTVLDYLPEEEKRKMSVFMSLAPIEWRDHKVNLIDTPGYADFISEVLCVLRAVDSLVVTVCAVSGVGVQTELIWEHADSYNLPRLVYINKMDRENADFYRTLGDLRHKFPEKRLIPLQFPIGSADSFVGMVDLLTLNAVKWDPGTHNWKEFEVPAEYQESIKNHRVEMVEAAAEADDELLMRYLDGEELETEEILAGLQKATKNGDVIPVLCGSAAMNIGTMPVLEKIIDYLPSPVESRKTTSGEYGSASDPFAGIVFKTIADNFIGKLSFMRIVSGTLKPDSLVYNTQKETDEKIARIFTALGKETREVSEAQAGDIVVLTKLASTLTGDTLCAKGSSVELEGIGFPSATYFKAISPKSKDDEDKLGNALDKLMEEDPSLMVNRNSETHETTIHGLGDMHIDVLVDRLKRKFGVDVNLTDPIIPYRETITKAVQNVEGKHKKQSGGHGQYGHVYIDLEPLAEGEFEFAETIFGGSVPKNYIPAVEKGIRDAMENGTLAGYPMTRLKVTLKDGSYHAVDSSEMAFKIAGALALKNALEKAAPVLLEPIMKVQVTVPEAYMGDIMGDLNTKRARIQGMQAQGSRQVINALAPLAEMSKYAIDLKSLTQGKGTFTMEFDSYDIVPAQLTPKIIEDKKIRDEKAAK